MTLPELGLALCVAEGIPLADGLQPSEALAVHLRARGSPLWAVEASGVLSRGAVELSADALLFVGKPEDDVTVSPLFGVGARLGDSAAPLLVTGFEVDMVLFPVLDLRAQTRVGWDADRGVAVTLGVGPQVHTPRRFDADGDGVSDRADRCDDAAEDHDGFLDADGCPDPDNDNDGVLDALDSCPAVAEDRDGFLDDDGCPDPDNDGDRLFDERDACLNEPEDDDGFRDLDGCPDPDNDGDGVLDTADRCPNVAEDRDGWEDGDGCPDPDNDGDGVSDRFDAAPNEPENINFFEDDDGRPEELPPLLQKFLGPQPKVRFDGDELTRGGRDRAELVGAALAQWPELRLRVAVADPDPERAARRAVNVAAVLVELGVAPDRVEPVGETGEASVVIALAPLLGPG